MKTRRVPNRIRASPSRRRRTSPRASRGGRSAPLPASRTSACRRPVPSFRAEPRSAALLDQAETIRDRFDEACEHAVRETGAAAGLAMGPLVSLKMEELSPGTLGWRRDVRGPEAAAAAEAWGTIGITVAPGEAAVDEPPEELVGSWSASEDAHRAVRVVSEGPPRVLLWSEARNDSEQERLRALVERVEEVYRAEPDTD